MYAGLSSKLLACDALHIRNTPKTPVNSHSLIPQIKEYDLLEFHGEFHVKKIDSRIAYLMLVMTIEYSTDPAQSNTILSVVIVELLWHCSFIYPL